MGLRAVATVSLAVMVGSCGPGPEAPDATRGSEGALQALVTSVVAETEAVRSSALCVDAPRLGLWWEGAAGMADPDGGVEMSPAHPFRIASTTKTFVAASVLRLVEDGRFGLDDPVAGLLSDEHVGALRDGGYRPERITVRHLLTHTSGLYDHTDGEAYGEAIVADPQHRWTRAEQVRAAMAGGEPWGEPGTVFHYSDTGYVLLGEIVERATGRPLAAAVRELVGLDRLGLESTWWETEEPAPVGAPARAHQFLGDLDTTAFDPSFDLYGGGGLVSTVGDLARFGRALFAGRVFARPETLETMLTTVDGVRVVPEGDPKQMPAGAYRMGVWSDEVEGLEAYRHTGFWGSSLTYVPELDLVVAATVNQNGAKEALEELAAGATRLVL